MSKSRLEFVRESVVDEFSLYSAPSEIASSVGAISRSRLL